MTHFKVAVITKDAYPDNEDEIMDLLASFNENISVEEYILMDFNAACDRVSKRAEAERDWKIGNCDAYREKIKNANEEDFSKIKKEYNFRVLFPEDFFNGLNYEEQKEKALKEFKNIKKNISNEFLDIMNIMNLKNIEEFKKINDKKKYFEKIDDYGNAISTYNPKAKYDWYSIYCSWDAFFEDEAQTLGEIVNKKRDFPNDAELRKKAPGMYKAYRKKVKVGDWFSSEYYAKRYPTFRDYYIDEKTPYTSAILGPDGEWYEAGRVGWFASTTATPKEELEWVNKYYEILKKYPESYHVTIVDCHI